MKINFKLTLSLLTFLFVGMSFNANAQQNTNPLTQYEIQRITHFNLFMGMALKGNDPVEIQLSNRLIKGKSAFEVTYQGIKYRFRNEANMITFNSNPEKYEPAFGGWDAYAMGLKGQKVDVNPNIFVVQDGQLLYFYSNGSKMKWLSHQATLSTPAKTSWAGFLEINN